jgi:hypothetical protein
MRSSQSGNAEFYFKPCKEKLSLFLTKHYVMKEYGGVVVYIHIFSTSALAGGECSASLPGRFTPVKKPRYPLDRRLSGTRSRSRRRGKENILDPTGIRTPAPL